MRRGQGAGGAGRYERLGVCELKGRSAGVLGRLGGWGRGVGGAGWGSSGYWGS